MKRQDYVDMSAFIRNGTELPPSLIEEIGARDVAFLFLARELHQLNYETCHRLDDSARKLHSATRFMQLSYFDQPVGDGYHG